MSSAFGGILPAVIPFSATCDSSGNATITLRPRAAFWWSGKMVGFSSGGAPTWTILEGQIPAGVAEGQRAEIGGLVVAPGDVVTIQVIGATPQATISGSLRGNQAATMADAAQDFSAAPNTVGIKVSNPRQKLFPDGVTPPSNPLTPSFTVAAGATATQRFTLPSGTTDIRILVSANGLVFTYSLLVTGHQSTVQYFGQDTSPGTPASVPTPTLPFTIPIEIDWDRQIDISLHNTGAFQVSVFFSALFAPEPPGQAGSAQSVIIPTASPWQAAFSSVGVRATPGALNTDFTIVAGIAGAVIYIHDVEFNNNTGNNWEIDLWDGPSVNGIKVADFQMIVMTGVGASPTVHWDGRGRPLTNGNSLIGTLAGGAAGGTAFGTVGYSQA